MHPRAADPRLIPSVRPHRNRSALSRGNQYAAHEGHPVVSGKSRNENKRAYLRYDMIWYGMVWYGMEWYGMEWYGMEWYGMVWYGMVWYGTVWYGMVWYGVVWYGMEWYGMVRYGMVWHGMVSFDDACYNTGRTQPFLTLLYLRSSKPHPSTETQNIPEPRRYTIL